MQTAGAFMGNKGSTGQNVAMFFFFFFYTKYMKFEDLSAYIQLFKEKKADAGPSLCSAGKFYKL